MAARPARTAPHPAEGRGPMSKGPDRIAPASAAGHRRLGPLPPLRAVALVAVLALLLAACSASLGASPTRKPKAATPPEVTVPGNFTALTLTPLSAPTFPFRGTDAKYHIAYDLQLTNASLAPATLERIDVVDGTDPERVLASFTGAALVDPTCVYGDCNRL